MSSPEPPDPDGEIENDDPVNAEEGQADAQVSEDWTDDSSPSGTSVIQSVSAGQTQAKSQEDQESEDWTTDERESSDGRQSQGGRLAPYNQVQAEDTARKWIAYSLIGLLTIVVVGIFALLAARVVGLDEIEKFSTLLAPLIALVSSATGFYYGAKSNK